MIHSHIIRADDQTERNTQNRSNNLGDDEIDGTTQHAISQQQQWMNEIMYNYANAATWEWVTAVWHKFDVNGGFVIVHSICHTIYLSFYLVHSFWWVVIKLTFSILRQPVTVAY